MISLMSQRGVILKLKFIAIILFLLIVYMILPSSGLWVNDVNLNTQDSRSSLFSSYASSKEEFVSKADIILNPDVDFIVHPATSYTRDGKSSPNTTLHLTSGWIRSGNYNTGKIHGALDTDVTGQNTLTNCNGGYDACESVALIAPVSGTVTKVVNNAGHEKEYFGDMVHTSMVAIQARGAFEGWTIYVMHLASIPDYIIEGYTIKQGDYIGFQSSQGRSTGPHVHLDVRSGNAKVPITEWMPHLTTHSSIKSVKDSTSVKARLNLQGWVDTDVTRFDTNPKYESEVIIPDQFKTAK